MLNLDDFLAPISDDAPAGKDLSFSPEFDVIQEARRSDDATLDQGDWVKDLKSADWLAVINQCSDLLQNRSKDLRLAAWMIEAGTMQHQFEGFADGCYLMAELCNQFWDGLHPEIEDGDYELRLGNLGWMLKQSLFWVQTIPLTTAPEGRYSTVNLEVALRSTGGEGSEDHADLATIDAARAATPKAYYQGLIEHAPRAQDALKTLEQAVDARLGLDGPSFTSLRETLETVCDHAIRMARDSGVVPEGEEELESEQGAADNADHPNASAGQSTAVASASQGPINTRRDALKQLRQVADFFRRTEPHSPVAYLAERAANWGEMPLHVWLKTVLKEDNASLGQLQELLGVTEENND